MRRHPLRHLGTMTDGSITVEFALVAMVLVLVAFGSIDFGRIAAEQIRLSGAARAGTQYGIQDQLAIKETNAIIAAVREDARDTAGVLTVSTENYCRCPGGTANVACTATCENGLYAPRYVQVRVQNTIQTLFPYPGIPSPVSLSATASMRVR